MLPKINLLQSHYYITEPGFKPQVTVVKTFCVTYTHFWMGPLWKRQIKYASLLEIVSRALFMCKPPSSILSISKATRYYASLNDNCVELGGPSGPLETFKDS